MDLRSDKPCTAGRIAPTGRLTPSIHQSVNGKRKVIPVPPPRIPTPMPIVNNNKQRNSSNVQISQIPPVQKKESHGNIGKIARRYLDDNMQQVWINPRLISMINMEAVTSTDYDSANLSHNFNQIGFSTYNYSQFEEKYKSTQQNSTKLGTISQTLSSQSNDFVSYLYDDKYPRNQLKSERDSNKQHSYLLPHEVKSKSQNLRGDLTYYQIDPPGKHDTRHSKCHRSDDKNISYETHATTIVTDDNNKKDGKDENNKRDKSGKHTHVNKSDSKINNGALSINQQFIKSTTNESDDECHLSHIGQISSNQHHHQQQQFQVSYKYRQLDRPPKYQEYPPRDSLRCEQPAPRYYQDPPKYSDVIRRDDLKKIPEEKGRRQVGIRSGSVGETPVNLVSITPTTREVTRGAMTRHRQTNKQQQQQIIDDSNQVTTDNSKEPTTQHNFTEQTTAPPGLTTITNSSMTTTTITSTTTTTTTSKTDQSCRNNFNGGIILGVNVSGY
ncbi:Protein of unknown function [Cotesia congregata]|uniref:Uncharacterized protein n=1 Tax=Cotesia congregata TaxID=51543 RepID=A0A8J2EA37_COTCN|nr:Protein of unknown function [Cotesia congregata]